MTHAKLWASIALMIFALFLSWVASPLCLILSGFAGLGSILLARYSYV